MTNQLVGVVTRFREEQIAFIAYVEAASHQVRVPEDQRMLLRFLWWENGDIRNPIEDHEMCVHLFGGISSPIMQQLLQQFHIQVAATML